VNRKEADEIIRKHKMIIQSETDAKELYYNLDFNQDEYDKIIEALECLLEDYYNARSQRERLHKAGLLD